MPSNNKITALIKPPAFTAAFLSPDGQRLTWRAYLILALVGLAFYLPGLTALPPVDRDEPLFAQATKQMIETGDYVDIRFQEETRYKKPVGIYWLQAASVKLLSPHKLNEIWAYRIPSLVGATGTVVMTAALGSLMFGPLTGMLAALLIAASLLLNVEARLAKTDAMLLFTIMVAQFGLAKAYFEQKKQSWPLCFAFWTAQSASFLIKGPLLLLLTLALMLGLRWKDKNLIWFKALRPLLGIPYALLLIAPWFAAITLASKGQFIADSAGHDFLAKIWQGQNRGMLPPGLHLLVFPIAFFPGSLLAMKAIPDVWRERHDSRIHFCLSWIVPLWVAFELALTKLPHYVLPAYPPIALLAAHMALKKFPTLKKNKNRWIGKTAHGIWLLAGTLLALIMAGITPLFNQTPSLGGIIAAATLLVMMTFVSLAKKRQSQQFLALGVGFLPAMLITFGFVLPSLNHVWLSHEVVQVAEKVKPCEELKIISASYNEPSLIFLAGTGTKTINADRGMDQLMRQDPCRLALVDNEHAAAILDDRENHALKPVEIARFFGPNIGSGRRIELALYRMQKPEE